MPVLTPKKVKDSLAKLSLSTIQNEVSKIIVRDRKIIERKRDELKAGVNPDGSKIGEYQSDSYAVFKHSRNPFAGLGNVDLMLTGAYERGIRVLSLGNSVYTLRSTDGKRDALIGKYGEKTEGINEEVWEALQKFDYAPKLFEALRKKI